MARTALMVAHNFPCVRVGKITQALKNHGWQHDYVCQKWPPQFIDAPRKIEHNPYIDYDGYVAYIKAHEAEIIHVHNEPNWPVLAAKEAANGRPVIFNVHDVTCARPNILDPYEVDSYAAADAFVFISEEQRQFAIAAGLPVEGKPYCCLGNYYPSELAINKTPLPHLGGVCYEGGADSRGAANAWRDFSAVADAIPLHLYPGNAGVDYGIVHPTEMEYPVLMHRLAQHDWGFTGTTNDLPAWNHSIPNKVYDYLCAGIPFIALRNPLVGPLCEQGLGIYCNTIEEVIKASKVDPKPYRKRVLAQRGMYSMERQIEPLLNLYNRLLGGANG